MIVVHHAGITFTCESMFIDENRHIARFHSSEWSTDMKNRMIFGDVNANISYTNAYVEVFLEKHDEEDSGC